MYQKKQIPFNEGQACKYLIVRNNENLHYESFLRLLHQDKSFRSFFINLLSDVPFHAYQWETPPVTLKNRDQPFEFVVHNSPGIDLSPDPGPFSQYFSNDADTSIAVFDNLGKDARLIAPAPSQPEVNYSHIGVFTQSAPMQQQHDLWKTVGRVTEEHLSEQPLWLNTAGGGVAWLHVRLDSKPKYYRHRPYMAID